MNYIKDHRSKADAVRHLLRRCHMKSQSLVHYEHLQDTIPRIGDRLGCEDASQRTGCLVDRTSRCRCIGNGVQDHKRVDSTQIARRRYLYTGLHQLTAIGFTLVAEHVALGGDDERRR